MTDTTNDFGSGLAPDQDLVLARQPDNPDMRESASLWLFEDNGAFAFPRMGIEAVAATWETHRFDINIACPGGRVLRESGTGPTLPSLGDDGRPTILGAGPLRFECQVPFRRWRAVFDGAAVDGDVALQVRNTMDPERRSPVQLDVTMEMAAPAWVQDNSPRKLAGMDSRAVEDAGFMGIGYRFEQLFRASGTLRMDGASRTFSGTGLRIHRRSERPLAGFRGHCWQSALFPDGNAFGYIAYPPHEDGSESYNEGYVYKNGVMYPARATKIPWLRHIVDAGDAVAVELESELGLTRIEGVSTLSTFRVGNPDLGGLNLNQGGARYTWDGRAALGMIERSSHESLTRILV
jgi:hypothetical protein